MTPGELQETPAPATAGHPIPIHGGAVHYGGRLVVDLTSIEHNYRQICATTTADVMAVVKGDGYGHGMVPVARAALRGGARWLGVAHARDALALRDAGIREPIFSWLHTPGDSLLDECLGRGIDVAAADVPRLDELAAAGRLGAKPPRVHLKVDTGMGRGGLRMPDFRHVAHHAAALHASGAIDVVGLWSHLAMADEPTSAHGRHVTTDQYRAFEEASRICTDTGMELRLRHIVNSAGALTEHHPYDLARVGLAGYGLSPVEGVLPGTYNLRPAATLEARLAMTKDIPAGAGVSYGHSFTTERDTRIGVVPLGYADGVPRHASNRMWVWVEGHHVPIVGRVCMDQFMVDLGPRDVQAGDTVLLFGDGSRGEPTAHEWAEAMGTIAYEIITRIGASVPRAHIPR